MLLAGVLKSNLTVLDNGPANLFLCGSISPVAV
jgi:hypothetical protein